MKNRLITSITLLLLFLTVTARPAQSEQSCYIAAPYVLHVDHNSAQILWLTPAGTPGGQVVIETDAGQQQQQIDAQVTTPMFQDRDYEGGVRDYLRHQVQAENLLPYTRYRYEVHCGDGETTSNGSFITAPEPGARVPFEFVATADIHDSRRHIPVAELIGEIAPAFVIQAGDLTGGRGHDWDNWVQYFSYTRSYLETSTIIPVVGGHDIRPNRNFRSLFAFNDPDGEPSDEDRKGTWYTHRFGNLEIIVIDHTRDLDRQLIWAEEVLSQTDAEWIVATLHEPFTNAGGRGNVLRHIFRDFAELFEKYGVDLVITGHDHIYERKIPLGSVGNKPVHYITVNSAGNHREVRPSPIVAGGIGQKAFMFSHFRVDGNRLEMESIDHEGNVIDRLELIKDNNNMYQQEIMEQAIDLDMARTLAHIYTGQSMSEDLRYERRDLAAEFADLDPDDWSETTLRLNTGITGTSTNDVSRFPIGSHLIVYEQTDPSRWRMPHQVVEITGDYAEVKVMAPEGFTYDENGMSHALEMKINLRLDGREFDPVTVRPVVLGTGSIGKVKLLHPADSETVEKQPVFTWEEEPGAAYFKVQLGDEGLDHIILDTLVEGHSLIYNGKLEKGTAYSWRVRGFNNFDGPWSDVATFWVQEPADSDDIKSIFFSINLVPAEPIIELPSVKDGSMGAGFRGRHSLYTWLEKDEPLTLSVTGGTISHFRDRGNVQFTLYSYRNATIETVDTDDSVPPDGNTYEITLKSPYRGLHRLDWSDGNDRTYVRWPDGHPMSVHASRASPFSFQAGFELYFYVPKGIKHVGGIIDRHSSVHILDGDGNEVPGWQNLDENEGYFLATVPNGQDGTLWRIGSRSRATLTLLTVPPYLARNDMELLLPAEVMEEGWTPMSSESEEENDNPSSFELRQNYPNPFNPSTNITFSVPERTHVRLEVYNIIGQRISTLRNGVVEPGVHEVYFDASDLSSGLYLYRLQTESFVDSKQMMLLK
jgi:hypothetical protein